MFLAWLRSVLRYAFEKHVCVMCGQFGTIGVCKVCAVKLEETPWPRERPEK